MSNSTRDATATGTQRSNDSQRERPGLLAGVLLFGLVLGTFLPSLLPLLPLATLPGALRVVT